MTSKWAPSLFKGRIGEAIVEAILSEFGYKVERSGYEQVSTGVTRAAPDLLVTAPRTQEKRYVEVKYRSARPTTVQLDASRIFEYRKLYPGTILAVSSAWDGAIYCTEVESLPLRHLDDGANLSLLDEYWMPLWHYFPLVKPGERLKRTWKELQGILSGYGNRQVLGRQDMKLWDAEYDALASYLQEVRNEDLLNFGIPKPQIEKMSLEDLWQTAREINAVRLAKELLDPSDDNPVETPLMMQVVDRVLGRRSEENLLINLEDLANHLGTAKDDIALQGIGMLISGLAKRPFDDKLRPLANRLIKELDDGVGECYLLDQAIPLADTKPIDLKTAIKLAMSPCRLDR